jgi:hypothetical protein
VFLIRVVTGIGDITSSHIITTMSLLQRQLRNFRHGHSLANCQLAPALFCWSISYALPWATTRLPRATQIQTICHSCQWMKSQNRSDLVCIYVNAQNFLVRLHQLGRFLDVGICHSPKSQQPPSGAFRMAAQSPCCTEVLGRRAVDLRFR